MDALGHSQPSVTMNTYSHVRPSLVDAAAAAMDRALSEPGDACEDERGIPIRQTDPEVGQG